MLVFYELDNLEFVYLKFNTGLIDYNQIVRACLIFESRCMNKDFRMLSYRQVTGNYSVSFQNLIDLLIYIGSELENDLKQFEDQQ